MVKRLDELSLAFKEAARRAAESRVYNMQRLQWQANANELNLGDHVCLRAHDWVGLDAKWDHGYVVVHIRGPIITIIGPQNSRRTVNREHVQLVDPTVDWKELNPRVMAQQRQNQTSQEQTMVLPTKRAERHRRDVDDPDYIPPYQVRGNRCKRVWSEDEGKDTGNRLDLDLVPTKWSRPVGQDEPEHSRYNLRPRGPSTQEQDMQINAILFVLDYFTTG